MIERLAQLTMSQFIDLICGDSTVIIGNEEPSGVEVAAAIRRIVSEYREIADPSGSKGELNFIEDLTKSRMTVEVFRMCRTLVLLKEHGRAREVLSEYGIKAAQMSDERVEAEIASRYEKARRSVAKLEKEISDKSPENDAIRRSFDELTAILMAHFKFQIDTSVIKASIYAHLVARHTAELKAQIAAAKKK